MPPPAALRLSAVDKDLGGRPVLRGVDLEVAPGTIVGLLGPNGAGKTTSLRIVLGLLEPDAGTVRVLGEPPSSALFPRLGFLPEERGLYRRMTVRSQLVFFARLRGLSGRDANARIDLWLDRFGLLPWAERKAGELSKGMLQKVQLASTLLHDPELLILDEPFSGLDPASQDTVREMLVEQAASGRAVLLSTHLLAQAEKVCESVTLLSRGRVVRAGPLPELRREAGPRRFRVRFEGPPVRPEDLPGVLSVDADRDELRITVHGDRYGQRLLEALLHRGSVRSFRPVETDLEALFLRETRGLDGSEPAVEEGDP